MNVPISLLRRPGRGAAVVGAVLALTTTATVALVTTASADEPGRCLENVNIREKPDVNSRIVALCEAGTEVQVSETRDGFVHLTDLGGWAAQQYVAVNGRPAPAASEQDTPEPGAEDGAQNGAENGSEDGSEDGTEDGEGSSDETQPEMEQESGHDTGQEETDDGGNTSGYAGRGGLGSLLG